MDTLTYLFSEMELKLVKMEVVLSLCPQNEPGPVFSEAVLIVTYDIFTNKDDVD